MTMRIASIIISLLLASQFVYAQKEKKTLDDLNREKARLQSLIEQNNKMMDEYKTRKNNEMMQISVVDSKIAKRKELIGVYNSEVEAYNGEIRKINLQIDSVTREIKKQKAEYAELLRQLQARGNGYSPLAFILSSQSLNQSYRRFLFLRQYNDYRRSQFKQLETSKTELANLKAVVSNKLTTINSILAQVKNETTKLNDELSARQTNVQQITKSQSDIEAQIKKAQSLTRKLDDQIAAVIREEAERARREAEAARKKAEAEKNKSSKKEAVKDTSEPLSEQILENKGRLPWPVRSFVITSAFGEHDHPLVPQIKISNNGVDMDILASKDIHPVHKGKVSRVIVIPGSGATVIIRHGEILTVYSNLSEVFVKKDQEVNEFTNIGKVYTGEGLNSNILHFEIWQGENKQDPELWLRKQ